MHMNRTIHGLHEGALSLTYNLFLIARSLSRQLTRPTQVGVRIVVPRGDRVLLVRHRGGDTPWSLPGGGLEQGESPDLAARREVREEASCTVRPGYLLGVYHSYYQGMTNVTAVFVCEPLSDAAAPAGDLEIVDARFFLMRDLPTTTDPGSVRRIAEYRRGERGLASPW